MVETYKTVHCETKAKETGQEGLACSIERLFKSEERERRCLCRNELITNEQNGESKIDHRNKVNVFECLALKISWRMISYSIDGNKRQSENKFQSQNSCLTNSTKIKTKRKTFKGNIGSYNIGEYGRSLLKIQKPRSRKHGKLELC